MTSLSSPGKWVWVLLLLLAVGSIPAADAEEKAFGALRTAAEQGDPAAQFKLAQRYRAGKGTPVDELEAFYWNGRAAQQGHAEAQLQQGLSYRSGKLFPADLLLAYMWLRLADAGDQPLAKPVINRIVSDMSAAEVAEGERMFRVWERTFGSDAVWSCARDADPST